jgi:xanthine dehydrogenase YagR molybdenum-binding subunit
MVQVAADELGIPIEKIRFELGDTNLPHAPQSVASLTVNSVAPAVKAACTKLRGQAIALATQDQKSPLYGHKEEEINKGDGWLFLDNDPSVGET